MDFDIATSKGLHSPKIYAHFGLRSPRLTAHKNMHVYGRPVGTGTENRNERALQLFEGTNTYR